ncbi:hypothetical protein PIB30_064296 [Stylosanthes scabra]|uniref:Uncharacterized protein n=1 Tax=Stylosanthes scabra TaxID=79078 RepID=A0ABU6XK57_9FABA|nr:hypothetical protein [Stylosanthes scabra]
MDETRANFKNQGAVIKNSEMQVREIAKQLAHRPTNTFPSDTITNPKEECKVINVLMVEEAPIQEEKVEAETKAIIIAPPPSKAKNLREMPAYVHSMKEPLIKKRSLKQGETVVMTKECSELI